MTQDQTAHVRRGLGSELVIGTWLSLASAAAAEVLGALGFDWLLIDQQHSAIGPHEMTELVRAVAGTGAAPVVRIPANSPEYFAYALDAGAHGVMVPMVEDAEEARAAVRSFSYPPRGERSMGGYRAPMAFGLTRAEYFAKPPAVLILQVEHRRAIENAAAIASVPGVDALFIGPQDLSASYGLAPSLSVKEPQIASAIATLVRSTRPHRVALGTLCADDDAASWYAAQGFTIIAIGTDAQLLGTAGSAHVAAFKHAAATRPPLRKEDS